MKQTKKEKIKKIARRVFYTLLIGFTVFALFSWHRELFLLISSAEARQAYIEKMRAAGLGGLAAFLGLQVLQVLVAVIPGEPIEVMAGVLYGTWGGLVICLTGVLLGSVLIYYFVKSIGRNPLKNEAHVRYRILNDPKRVEVLLFLLFLVPGTPKDILLYFAPFLPVKASRFFLLATLARIPSVVTSTFAGAHLAKGDFKVTVAVFLCAGAAGLLGILYNEKLLTLLEKRRAKISARLHHEQSEKDQ